MNGKIFPTANYLSIVVHVNCVPLIKTSILT